MSERFEMFGTHNGILIKDNEMHDNQPQLLNSCLCSVRLNEFVERIAELEEQLKNAIVPKFKIGQEVFVINKNYFYIRDYEVECHKIVGIEDKLDRKNKYVRWYTLTFKNAYTGYVARYKYLEKDVFTSKEEALEKLKELQGE